VNAQGKPRRVMQVVDPDRPHGHLAAPDPEALESIAGAIYGVYQYCTTLNSAFACWG
jgi:hypothetical protein